MRTTRCFSSRPFAYHLLPLNLKPFHAILPCSPGEKAAVSRYLHEGRDVRALPFVRAHLDKVAAVEAYTKEVRGSRCCL